MKLKEKKILAIILTITICISSMINTSICGVTPEDDGKEAVYAEDKNEIKEDYEKISFSHSFKIQSEWENHYTAEMILKNTGKNEIESWEVAFEYDGEIENIWNAKIVSHYDNVYVIKNVGWNKNIKDGEQVVFGLTVKFAGEKPEKPCNVDMQRISEQVYDDCSIQFKQFTKYENKIQGQVEITNTSDNYIEDWFLEFESNFKIIDIWNAKINDFQLDNDENNSTIAYYSMANVGYNQSIEPGQTINFGFIGELLGDNDSKIENEALYQLTVYPYEDEEILSENDCIWEDDVENDESMSVVEDEVFDEDDYDRMEEDALAAEADREETIQLFTNNRSVSTTALSNKSGRKKGDKSHGRICLSDFTGKYHLCHQEQDPYRGAAAGRKTGRAETGRGVWLQPGTHPGGAAAAGTGGHGRVFAQCGLLGAPGEAGGRLRDLSAAGKSGNDGAALF